MNSQAAFAIYWLLVALGLTYFNKKLYEDFRIVRGILFILLAIVFLVVSVRAKG